MICGDLDPLLHAYVDGEFTAEDAFAVEAHLARCRSCDARVSQERRDRATLRAHLRATRAMAPPSVHASVEMALQRERRRATTAQLARWGSLTLAVASFTTVAWNLRTRGDEPLPNGMILQEAGMVPSGALAPSPASVQTWFDGKMRHPVLTPRVSNVKLAGTKRPGPPERPAQARNGPPVIEVVSGSMYELVTDIDENGLRRMVGPPPSSPYFIQPASLSGP